MLVPPMTVGAALDQIEAWIAEHAPSQSARWVAALHGGWAKVVNGRSELDDEFEFRPS